jgi:hypothetical protein
MTDYTMDMYGTIFLRKQYVTFLDWASVLFPALTLCVLLFVFVAILRGYVPQKGIRSKMLLTTSLAFCWISMGNYHLNISTSPISDWIAHWLAGVLFTVSLLVHLELLAVFQIIGGAFTEERNRIWNFVILLLCVICMSGLYGFLPTLGGRPVSWIEIWYGIGHPVYVGFVTLVESYIILYLIICLWRFRNARRVRDRYKPFTIKKIIGVGFAGVLVSWVGAIMYLALFQKTYEGYCWWQISSSIGAWHWLTLPYIFHHIAHSKSSKAASEPTESVPHTLAQQNVTTVRM